MKKSTLILLVMACLFQAGCSLAPAAANRSYKAFEIHDYNESLRLATLALIKYEYAKEDMANLFLLKAESYLQLKKIAYAAGVLDYVINEFPSTEAAYKASSLLKSSEVLKSFKGHSYEELYAKTQAQVLTKAGFEYMLKVVSDENNKQYIQDLYTQCHVLEEGSGFTPSKIVMEILSNGEVGSLTVNERDAFVDCFVVGLKKMTYPTPPFNPSYLLFTLKKKE